jgi:hypothetical protein
MGIDVARGTACHYRWAAHAPWIEAPEKVFGAVRTFFEGRWPEGAEKVELADPKVAR